MACRHFIWYKNLSDFCGKVILIFIVMNTTNSLSLLLSLDYLNYMTALAAISYIIVGVIFLVFFSYIHLSMRQIKEAQLGNSF